MKNRALIPLAVGLAVGLIAVKFSVDVVKKARAASTEDSLSVVVAQQMIPMGVEVKPNMLSVTKTSRSLAPQGGFDDAKKLVGRVARTQIPKGVPVIEEMLAAPGTPAGLTSLVPAGYRAVAVKVDEFSSVGGFLKPGCRVDVAAVMSVRCAGASGQTISRVILQDVLVGAVGQSLTGEGDSGASISRSVTLLVKPDQVPILHLAATEGRIRLAMRHYEDDSNASTNVATEANLAPEQPKPRESLLSGLTKLFQGAPAPTAAPKPAWAEKAASAAADETPPPYAMTVINGDKIQTVTFQSPASPQRVSGQASKAAGRSAAARGAAVPSPFALQQQAADTGASEQESAPAAEPQARDE